MQRSPHITGVVAMLLVVGCGSASPALTASTAGGTWEGSWNNTTFGSTGAAKATVTVDAVAKKIDFALDLNGNVFGGVDPASETFSGPYTDSSYTVSGPSRVFGTLSLTVDQAGKITGSATPTRGSVSFTGTATTTKIEINYTLSDSSGPVKGTVTLNKKN